MWRVSLRALYFVFPSEGLTTPWLILASASLVDSVPNQRYRVVGLVSTHILTYGLDYGCDGGE